jgi:hypothetical protein
MECDIPTLTLLLHISFPHLVRREGIRISGIKFFFFSNLSVMLTTLYNLLEVVIVLVPILLAVAFMTIIERKTLAAMQRRVGPNKVGYYGVLQPWL